MNKKIQSSKMKNKLLSLSISFLATALAMGIYFLGRVVWEKFF